MPVGEPGGGWELISCCFRIAVVVFTRYHLLVWAFVIQGGVEPVRRFLKAVLPPERFTDQLKRLLGFHWFDFRCLTGYRFLDYKVVMQLQCLAKGCVNVIAINRMPVHVIWVLWCKVRGRLTTRVYRHYNLHRCYIHCTHGFDKGALGHGWQKILFRIDNTLAVSGAWQRWRVERPENSLWNRRSSPFNFSAFTVRLCRPNL